MVVGAGFEPAWTLSQSPVLQTGSFSLSDTQPIYLLLRYYKYFRYQKQALLFGVPGENRTPVSALKGQRTNRYTTGTNLEPAEGIEPTTCDLEGHCSTKLSYTGIYYYAIICSFVVRCKICFLLDQYLRIDSLILFLVLVVTATPYR